MKYEFVITYYFKDQLKWLSKKFPKVYDDFESFKNNLDPNFAIHLGEWVYKSRLKNSSVPTGKRWWFRLIVKLYWKLALPLIIYSKTDKSNITKEEILEVVEKILNDKYFYW